MRRVGGKSPRIGPSDRGAFWRQIDIVHAARSARLLALLLTRPVFPSPRTGTLVRKPFAHYADGIPLPRGEGRCPEELTNGHFECPPQSWNSRRTRPGRRAAAQCRRTCAWRRADGRRGGILH